eukprot:Rhum_TRINITY_DN8041_c0_g1::Rhum_TRINITY_DN8041_c0_g1_i1::g.25722::m.25722
MSHSRSTPSLSMSRFSGFTSLCTNPRPCRYPSAATSCTRSTAAAGSARPPPGISAHTLPPGQYSTARHTRCRSLKQPYSDTMLRWSRERWMRTSASSRAHSAFSCRSRRRTAFSATTKPVSRSCAMYTFEYAPTPRRLPTTKSSIDHPRCPAACAAEEDASTDAPAAAAATVVRVPVVDSSAGTAAAAAAAPREVADVAVVVVVACDSRPLVDADDDIPVSAPRERLAAAVPPHAVGVVDARPDRQSCSPSSGAKTRVRRSLPPRPASTSAWWSATSSTRRMGDTPSREKGPGDGDACWLLCAWWGLRTLHGEASPGGDRAPLGRYDLIFGWEAHKTKRRMPGQGGYRITGGGG